MTGNEKYLSELTREDLKRIAACTNISFAPGVTIDRTANGIKIGIDKQQLKLWMWTFYHNGGFSVSQNNVTSVNIDSV